jgi:ABC-type spermidine/putrescine transport system permease subunit II
MVGTSFQQKNGNLGKAGYEMGATVREISSNVTLQQIMNILINAYTLGASIKSLKH